MLRGRIAKHSSPRARTSEGDALAIYRACTDREAAPTTQAKEAWAICGRRAGKTRVLATVAAWLAAFVDWRSFLAPGEVGAVQLIACDRKQAGVAMGYLRSLIAQHPLLKQLVIRETSESIELSCGVVIQVMTASFRSVRGFTVVATLCDELAFWDSDEGAANPDVEIIAAIRPAMATIPGAMLLCASTPYVRHGALWTAFRRFYGQNGPILVWRAATRTMNSSMPQAVVDHAMELDSSSAASEYMAEFRIGIESYIAREVVDAAVVPGRHELPPVSGTRYVGFVDPSGGSEDSMTLAIAHREGDRVVLDCVRERRPPLSPHDAVSEFAAMLKSYGVGLISGDKYAGEWPVAEFAKYGIRYEQNAAPKGDLYRDFLPILNSGRCELLDLPRLVAQLAGLERRTARSGKDSIDHGPGGHDDVANAVAGALTLALAHRPFIVTWEMVAEVRRATPWHVVRAREAMRRSLFY